MILDFVFRKTRGNLEKIKALADDLGAVVMRPYYPVIGLDRLSRDEDGLQLDFKFTIDGIRSFEALNNLKGLKKRSRTVKLAECGD